MADAQLTGDDGQEALILQSVDRFLEREVRPVVRELEAADTYPAAMADKLAEMGLFGATIAPEHGGLGLPALTYARIIERMSAVWISVPGFINSHLIMAAAVQRYGTETQQRTLAAALRERRAARRHRADRARLRHRSCRRYAPPRAARAITTSSTAPRCGSPTAQRARSSRCW